MKDEKYKLYLSDLGFLLKEYAVEAKVESDKENSDFSKGYLMGFHRIITLMQQQAEGFEISLEDIGLKDIDPDKDFF